MIWKILSDFWWLSWKCSFLQDFLVATSVHFVATRRDCIKCILGAQIGPRVIVSLRKYGDEAVIFILFGLFAQTAKLLLYLFLFLCLFLKRKKQGIIFVLIHLLHHLKFLILVFLFFRHLFFALLCFFGRLQLHFLLFFIIILYITIQMF